MGPPSSGGALLINMLNMMENFSGDSLKWNSSDYVHVMTEIQRRAYSDRAKHMGDPEHWDVPIEMFKSKEYAKIRSDDISMNRATPSNTVYPGNPNGSEKSAAAIASNDGRHLAIMPHLERSIFPWNWGHYEPNRKDEVSPWILPFQNARKWLEENA